MKNPHKIMPQFIAAAIGSLGFFCAGAVQGWSSSGLPSLNATHNFNISQTDLNWIASTAPLCTMFGTFTAIIPLQYVGCRRTQLGASVAFIIGFLLVGFTYFAQHKVILYVGFLLSGFTNGIAIPAAQQYVSECASPGVRGILSSLTGISLVVGILVAYIIGAFVEWYVLAWVLGCLPIIPTVLMIFIPESPIWLLANCQEEEARKALRKLRGKLTDIEPEISRIKKNLEKELANHDSKKFIQPRDLLKAFVWKPLLISMTIMFFQQFTGINALVFYMMTIFQTAGSCIDGRYATIMIGFIQLICTITSGFFVDRFGRKVLLIGSAAIVAISLASIGAFFYMQHLWGEAVTSNKMGWFPLLSLIVFIIAYSSGISNVPFIIIGELLPARYRSILSSIIFSFNSLCIFIVVRSFPAMVTGIGEYGVFWFFMCCTLLSIPFVVICLPETKGLTLEDIEQLFFSKCNDDNNTPLGPENRMAMSLN